MPFKRILCPTDFSPGSEQALRVAMSLAAQYDSELVIVHCWYMPPSAYSLEYPFPPATTHRVHEDARRQLDDVVNLARANGAKRVSGELLTGIPWAEIVQTLENPAFDLCVIGTHGRSGISRVLLGSVAEKIVRHAACSVLTVPPGRVSDRFENILVPTDFSASADHAVDLATELVQPKGSITLLHVIELPVRYSGALPLEGIEQDLDHRATVLLDRAAKQVATRTTAYVRVQYRIGYPGAETLALLEQDSVDLVVMGSHGRTGIRRVLLGSVAEKVVRHAGRPVLVARKREVKREPVNTARPM